MVSLYNVARDLLLNKILWNNAYLIFKLIASIYNFSPLDGAFV